MTMGMYLLGFTGSGIVIYFGVLHALGCCMLLWPVLRKLSNLPLLLLSILLLLLGWHLRTVSFAFPWLLPLGLMPHGFSSSDYFPLLPNLGYFLLGAVAGRAFYPKKQSLLPRVNPDLPPIRFLCQCGMHSLWIYLLHQPILVGLIQLMLLL